MLNRLKIVSGGQTGVDRAALDVAMQHGMACGGWCPKGRRAEDGRIDSHYPLTETPERSYSQRTEWNVRDSDATLIITREMPLSGGTAFTFETAQHCGKPVLVVDLTCADMDSVSKWLLDHSVKTLNIAGPRESKQPGIYSESKDFLLQLLQRL
jgi:predicted Rossmann fold nucleotide-binding protein DprA/Smf involved in DNA uptake